MNTHPPSISASHCTRASYGACTGQCAAEIESKFIQAGLECGSEIDKNYTIKKLLSLKKYIEELYVLAGGDKGVRCRVSAKDACKNALLDALLYRNLAEYNGASSDEIESACSAKFIEEIKNKIDTLDFNYEQKENLSTTSTLQIMLSAAKSENKEEDKDNCSHSVSSARADTASVKAANIEYIVDLPSKLYVLSKLFNCGFVYTEKSDFSVYKNTLYRRLKRDLSALLSILKV